MIRNNWYLPMIHGFDHRLWFDQLPNKVDEIQKRCEWEQRSDLCPQGTQCQNYYETYIITP